MTLHTTVLTPNSAGNLRWLNALIHLYAIAMVLLAMNTMVTLAPKVLYADPWRFTARFLSMSWPGSVLVADNGHREILPNLVRLAELHWFAGNQWLQIVVGVMLAVLTVGLWLHAILRSTADVATRAAAALFMVLGIFWLGNVRTLAHANESVHAYLILLCLIAGFRLLCLGDLDTRRLLLVSAAGLIAAFSFGSGIAVFAGFLAVLWMRRAPISHLLWMVIAAVATVALYLGIGDAGPGIEVGDLGLTNGGVLMRWLAAPFVYVLWPMVDSDVAAQIPIGAVRGLCQIFAGQLEPYVPMMSILAGTCGCAALLWSTWKVRRGPETASPLRIMGLGLAWFALGVGVLITLSRAGYFQHSQEQVAAPRYLVWSSLFWSGLAISSLDTIVQPRRRAALALLSALLLIPSQVWMLKLAHRVQMVAETSAVAAAVGVLPDSVELGETELADLRAALPLLREAKTSIYAWRETQALEQQEIITALPHLDIPVRNWQVESVDSRLGLPGLQIRFELPAATPCARLVLLDTQRRVAGIATWQRGEQWIGWSRRSVDGVAAICPEVQG